MIRRSCVEALSLRRIAHSSHPFPPRNCNSGLLSYLEMGRTRATQRLQTAHVVRRHNASKSSMGRQAPSTAKTIPGPSWLWLEPIYEPFRKYGRVQQRRPYMTQLISSLVIYFVGDLVAQSIAGPTATGAESLKEVEEDEEMVEKGWVQQWSEERDWARTGRALVIGGLSSIPSYKWFLWLSNNFNYSSKIWSLTVKVTVNQALFTPLFNSYFFGMQSLLSGATSSEILERIKNTVPTSWINSCKLWPIVTAFSFTYIPIQYRSIFGGVIAIGWQTYLSLLNQRAAALELGAGSGVESEVRKHMATRTPVRQEREEHEGQKCAA